MAIESRRRQSPRLLKEKIIRGCVSRPQYGGNILGGSNLVPSRGMGSERCGCVRYYNYVLEVQVQEQEQNKLKSF